MDPDASAWLTAKASVVVRLLKAIAVPAAAEQLTGTVAETGMLACVVAACATHAAHAMKATVVATPSNRLGKNMFMKISRICGSVAEDGRKSQCDQYVIVKVTASVKLPGVVAVCAGTRPYIVNVAAEPLLVKLAVKPLGMSELRVANM